MTAGVRKFMLTTHVTVSVGWLGAVVAYLALALTGLNDRELIATKSAYVAMETIGWFVIVPFSLAALATGLIQALGTEWGLIRHYWILAKFLLTVGGVTVLLLHLPRVTGMAEAARDVAFFNAETLLPRTQLVLHAAGGLLVLVVTTILSITKPWGMTPYGRRKQQEESTDVSTAGRPWKIDVRWVIWGVVGLALLFLIVQHIAGGRMRHHG
jgi:hypothetical protein